MQANIEIGTVRPKVSAMPPMLQMLVLRWLKTGADAPAPAKRGERRVKSADAATKAPARRNPLLETRTAGELHVAGESPAKLAAQEAKAIAKGAAWRPIVVSFADGSTITAGSFMADDEAAKADAVRFARSAAIEAERVRREQEYREAVTAAHEAYFVPPRPADDAEFVPPAYDDGWRWLWSEADGRNVRVNVQTIAEVAAVEIMPQAWAPAAPAAPEVEYEPEMREAA